MPHQPLAFNTERFPLFYNKRPKLLRASVSAVVLAHMLLASGGVAWADDTWNGKTNTDWFTATNWASGKVPTTGMVTVTAAAADVKMPIINKKSAQVDYFTIGEPSGAADKGGSLTIQNGGQLTSNGSAAASETTVNYISGKNATLTVTGAGSKLTTASNLILGISQTDSYGNGNGILNINAGATAELYGLEGGSVRAQATELHVSGEGSQLTIGDGGLYLDSDTTSIVEVSDGAELQGKLKTLGNVAMTVEGQGSILSLSNKSSSQFIDKQSTLKILDGGNFYITNDNRSVFGGMTIIDGANSRFTKSGTGILVIERTPGSQAGGVTVSNGGQFGSSYSVDIIGSEKEPTAMNIGAAPGDAAVAPGILYLPDGLSVNSNAELNFNHTATDYIFSTAINGFSGTRGKINQISGTTILTANGTFNGIVTITGGTFQFGNDTATGSIGADIITGTDTTHKGTLAFGRTGVNSYSSIISGTGKVMQLGSGTTILTAENTYSGGTVFKAGKLSVSSDSKLGALAGGLTFDGGTLQVTGTVMKLTARTIDWAAGGGGFDIADAGNTFTVAQDLGAGGALTKLGDGTLVLSGTNVYKGGTNLDAGTLSVGSDTNLGDASGTLNFNGGTLQVTKDMSSHRKVLLASTGGTITVDQAKTATFGGVFANTLLAKGSFTKSGDGTLILTAANTYSGGTTISGGVLQLGDGTKDGALKSGSDIVNDASFVVMNSSTTKLSGAVSGTGSLTQAGTGMLELSGNNTYSGDTHINAGVLSVEEDDNLGTGDLNFNGGTLQVTGTHFSATTRTITWGAKGGGFDIADADNQFALSHVFAGSGALNKLGAGTLVLSGDSSGFSGETKVNAGTLRLDGGSLGTGTVSVASGSSLGGNGTIGGNTTVDGTLFSQSKQALTFVHDLTLNAGSNVDVTLNGAPSTNELFHVDGDLTVDGTLSVNKNSTVDIGTYRIFQSTNALTDNGMHIAAGSDPNYGLQVLQQQGQVNLVNSGGRTMAYWDGTQIASDGTVHGGDGTWNAANSNWADKDGNNNAPWTDDVFAVFQKAGGKVQIDAGLTPSVNGMQFAVDGYSVEGSTITLGGADNRIVVGDGTKESASFVATISSVLDGQNGFTKSGYGTLNLTGENSYSGTTTVKEGTLELSGNGSIANSAEIVLASTQFGHGNLLINKDQDFTLTNTVSGIGAVVKDGTGITTLLGNNTFSGGLSVKGGTAKAGIADHAFGSGNVSVNGGAVLDIANLNQTIGSLLGAASGDGNIDLGSGTLTLNQNLHSDYSGKISGTGGLTKNGDADLVLYGANDYSGATAVNEGALTQGAAGGFSGASIYSVASGASLELGGFSSNIAGLSNSGNVFFGGAGGTILTVSGDYTGNGGTLHMSAVFGDDNSLTDRMSVSGNTSGSSNIDITNNRTGFGDKTNNGIEIVSVGGSSNGIFNLNGDYVTKDGQQAIMTDSAYAYTLQKGGTNTPNDGNWYLVSKMTKDNPVNPVDPNCKTTNTCPTPPNPGPNPDPTPGRFSPAAPVYESYSSTLQALNKLSTLQQRVGERYLGGSNQAVWGRIEGAHNRYENGSTAGELHQDINTFIMQAGVDGQFYENESGKLLAGITGQYGNARSDIDNRTGDGSGSISTEGWGLGATATWYGNSGFYLDTQAQANWYDSDLDVDAINPTLKNDNKGFGYALSIEAGQRFAINENWSLTPQAQLMWSSVDFDTFTDPYGARISNRNGDSLTARLGLAANYANSWKGQDGRMINTSVYGITNLYQEIMGDARMNYAGTHMANDNDNTWGGIGAGGTYAWADNKYALYGEGSINTSLNNFAQSYALKGNVGFKVKW